MTDSPAQNSRLVQFGSRKLRREALQWIVERNNTDMVAPLIYGLRHLTPNQRPALVRTLRKLTGQRFGDNWFRWVQWQQTQPQITPFEGFDRFLGAMFGSIDSSFRRLIYAGIEHRIRLEEIVWGGTGALTGIPPLNHPPLVNAAQANWLSNNEPVFGVAINGDIRAYPYRIMDWHEMLNDTVGGVPVALAYCTLCGAGILYDAQAHGLNRSLNFGSSGLLYRSNKLMFDTATLSLWDQFSGEPVAGKLAHSYADHWPAWEKTLELTPSQCMDLYTIKKLDYEGHQVPIQLNQQTRVDYISHGVAKPNGDCEAEYGGFWSEGRFWDNHYQRVFIRIYVGQVTGTVDYADDTVKVAGVKGWFQEGGFFDAHRGTFAWSALEPACNEKLSQIYFGNAELRQALDDDQEDVIILQREDTGQYAGFVKKETVLVCEIKCHRTQITGVAVCLSNGNLPAIRSVVFKPGKPRVPDDVRAQTAYLHVSSMLQWEGQLIRVYTELCRQSRQLLTGRLQALASSNSPYALVDLYGIGHEFFPAGATAYVVKCVAQEVTRADYQNCTKEIPVTGTEKYISFADPITWVLKKTPTVLPCNSIMPVKWKLNGAWYASTPRTNDCNPPKKLIPQSLTQPDIQLTKGLKGGPWTPSDLRDNQDFQSAISAREPATQRIATEGSKGTEGGGTILSRADINYVTNYVGETFYLTFLGMGNFAIPLIGCVMLIAMLKVAADAVVRIIQAYYIRGCGPWMILATWDAMWNIFGLPMIIAKKAMKEASTPVAKVDPDKKTETPEMEAMPADAPPYVARYIESRALQGPSPGTYSTTATVPMGDDIGEAGVTINRYQPPRM